MLFVMELPQIGDYGSNNNNKKKQTTAKTNKVKKKIKEIASHKIKRIDWLQG